MAAMVSCFLGKARLLVQAAWQASAETIHAGRDRIASVCAECRAGADRRSRRRGRLALWRVLHRQHPQPAHATRLRPCVCPVLRLVPRSRPHADGDPPEFRDLRDRAFATLLIREDRRGAEEEGGGSAAARRRSAATPSGRPASPPTSLTLAPSSTRKKWLRTKARARRSSTTAPRSGRRRTRWIPKLGQYETTAFGRRAAQAVPLTAVKGSPQSSLN